MSAKLQQTFSGLKNKVQETTQEVRFLQEYNEKILESVPNPIILFDMEERIDYVNRAAREALNLPDGDMRKNYLFDLIEADELSQRRLREEIQTQVQLWEKKVESPAASGLMTDQLRDPLTHESDAYKEQANLRKELRIGPATYRYDLFHISELFGKWEQIGLVLRDTTAESRLQDQIIQTERLASLEVLTAGIGHELNNPLFGIMSLGESILDEKDIPHIKEHTRRILEDAKRMAGIIQDFSGQAQLERTSLYNEVDINHELDHALKMLGLNGPTEGLLIQKNYRRLHMIQGRPEEMVQVFINIIKNAIQAMKGKGTVELATNEVEGMIVIRISDSGPGIPHEFVTRIFDPFFTTKGPGQGIGLGLTIARRIVLNYGGVIDVETHEDKGTSFILTFPALESDSSDWQE
jgi:signal transduction histidine kinase